MEIVLKRIARRDTYTIGHLYIDGAYFCDTLEDKDRGLDQKLPLASNKNRKVKGETAIPIGRYRVTLGVQSQKYKDRKEYAFCKGFLPRLLNVPAFDGILMHIGNTARDSEGCILVGRNTKVGMVTNSTVTFWSLYEKLQASQGDIYITIM